VLGRGTTVVAHPDGRLADYLESLQRVGSLARAGRIETVLPGHGPALPEGQVARHVPGEADHSTWVNAATAAAGGADGTFAMLPPTLVTLEEVSGEPDVAAVLRRERSPRLLMPWLLRRPDGLSVRIDLDGVGGGEPGPASGIEDAA
jgi:hypothetical protein